MKIEEWQKLAIKPSETWRALTRHYVDWRRHVKYTSPEQTFSQCCPIIRVKTNRKSDYIGLNKVMQCSKKFRMVKIWSILPGLLLGVWWSILPNSLQRMTDADSVKSAGITLKPLWLMPPLNEVLLQIGITSGYPCKGVCPRCQNLDDKVRSFLVLSIPP